MWEFIQESVMLKNIYYLECRNRLKNPRYQNKSIKRNWLCYNDFQVSKTSIGWIWDINAQMQKQRKDYTLDMRIHSRIVIDYKTADTKIKVSWATDTGLASV